jgi:hypothetical protein
MLQDKISRNPLNSGSIFPTITKLVFWLILLVFDLCFSQLQQDPRIGLLPYHEQLKALQWYEENRRFHDNLSEFYEKARQYELSFALQRNNPRQYEQNLRALADFQNEFAQTIKFPSYFTPQLGDIYYQSFSERRESLINAADRFRHKVVELIERERNRLVENFVKDTVIAAVAVVATVVTGGASSPWLVGEIADWGTDLALFGYRYYNLKNRDAYDAINWLRSDEYKMAEVTASAAKVVIGFETERLGFKDTLQGARTTLQIASIGEPYYNKDTDKALTTAWVSYSIFSSFDNLTRDRISFVSQSKELAKEIDPKYETNYIAAQRWESVSNISRRISDATRIVSSLSTLYAVSHPHDYASASKLSSDLRFYSSILYYGSRISKGIAARSTIQANERAINEYGFISVPQYEFYNLSHDKFSSLSFDKRGTSNVFTNYVQKESNNSLSQKPMIFTRSESKIGQSYQEKLAKIKNPDLSTRYNLSYETLHKIKDGIKYNEEIQNSRMQAVYYDTILNLLSGNYYEGLRGNHYGQHLLEKSSFDNNFAK